MTPVTSIQLGLSRVRKSDSALTVSALLMVGALAAFVVGLIIDPRLITGAPAWLKPAKFAVSTAIYMFTLAWVFTYLSEWPRLRTLVGRGTAAIFIVEVAIIALQAWRGTTSHFNYSTPLDGALFAIMGVSNRAADAPERGCGSRAVAAAVPGSSARVGAASGDGDHDRRRIHRRTDDAAD